MPKAVVNFMAVIMPLFTLPSFLEFRRKDKESKHLAMQFPPFNCRDCQSGSSRAMAPERLGSNGVFGTRT
jgi:hypothetical protein